MPGGGRPWGLRPRSHAAPLLQTSRATEPDGRLDLSGPWGLAVPPRLRPPPAVTKMARAGDAARPMSHRAALRELLPGQRRRATALAMAAGGLRQVQGPGPGRGRGRGRGRVTARPLCGRGQREIGRAHV